MVWKMDLVRKEATVESMLTRKRDGKEGLSWERGVHVRWRGGRKL